MDFDDAKENIQPLAQGRNASILHASLKVESSQELLAQRKELENEIRRYTGDDPLSVWYNYIEWIEQSFPSGGKESGLQEVLSKCLSEFESEPKYTQDRRMIKLYIKFIDSHAHPAECYQQLFNAGIGTMVADFYIAWAYCYDLVGNTLKADEVFRRGVACRAQPLEELQEAHQHFGFTVGQRMMYKDDDSIKKETERQLSERRLALSSLRGHRRKQMVGSIRTGAAVKNAMPGMVKTDLPSTSSSQRSNVRVQVFTDENESPNVLTTPPAATETEEVKSVVRSIIDEARNQENQKEPGPWNKAHLKKKGKLFGKTTLNNELGFEIHEDSKEENLTKPCIPPIPINECDIKFDKPFIYPPNFATRSRPIKGWETPVTTEEQPDKNTLPDYNKCKLYPRPNVEFSPAELKAYNFFKRRGIENKFTKERDIYWGYGPEYNLRLYPHFAKASKPQILDVMDQPYVPDTVSSHCILKVAFKEIYNKEEKVERSLEEIMALRLKPNMTIMKTTDMEETMCVSSERQQRRKSFFPMRKSLAPSAIKASRKFSIMPECTEQNESGIKEDKEMSIARDIVKPAKEIPEVLVNIQSEVETDYVKSVIPKQSEDTSDVAKSVLPPLTMEKSSKVYHNDDDSVIEVPIAPLPAAVSVSSNKPIQSEDDDFQFKTPALPICNPPTSTSFAKPNKMHFEIFEDDFPSNKQQSPNNMPKPDFGCGSGGFFDPEETCSTQTFNIFIKSQSVSTPKAITKSQPQRLFNNVLKDVIPPQPPLHEEQQQQQQLFATPTNDIASDNSPSATTAYSPPRQQLSTILETSEHGTTQGTHTTGATTKSTLSSPEFEHESQVQTTIAPAQALETVKELSCETSTISSNTDHVDELMTSLKIHNKTDVNESKQPPQNLATPSTVRLQKRSPVEGGLHFSIYEDNDAPTATDTANKNDKQVGNFSRLEEREDTAVGVFKVQPSIRFQDDKTETISKMMLAPLQAVQFPDDKTETISKMMLAPLQTVQFPEERTETISKFMLAPPQPTIFEENKNDDLLPKILSNDRKHPAISLNQDDSFEFFGETPPKGAKHLTAAKLTEKKDPLAEIRKAADVRTPLTLDSKRLCDKNTPDLQQFKLQRQTALFEDEVYSKNSGYTNKSSQKQIVNSKSSLRDSFMPDFSVIEDSHQNQINPPPPPPAAKTSKSIFRDSFVPDFSIIEDSQPQQKPVQKKTINTSILPDFSIIEDSQPQQQQKFMQKKPANSSILPDFSIIEDSQPQPASTMQKKTINNSFLPDFSMNNSLKLQNQQKQIPQPQNYMQKKNANSSILPDFSIIEDSQQQQAPNVQRKTINNSFLPDFSMTESSKQQNQQKQTKVAKLPNNSFLPDFSHIPETQQNDNDSIIMQSQPMQPRIFKENAMQAAAAASSLQSSLSRSDNQGVQNNANHWKQTPNPKSVANQTQVGTSLKNILMDTFMKDFSQVNEPPPIPQDVKEMSLLQPCKNVSSLRFLNESLQQKSQISKDDVPSNKSINTSIQFSTSKVGSKLHFLAPPPPTATKKSPAKTDNSSGNSGGDNKFDDKYFELNCETEMFGTNMSMIKNSTWLPNHGPMSNLKKLSNIQEDSLHIKHEEITPHTTASNSNLLDSTKPKLSFIQKSHNFSIDISASEIQAINNKKLQQSKKTSTASIVIPDDDDVEDDCNMSIYYKKTPKTPKVEKHIWDDADAFKTPANNNRHVHVEPDLNETHQVIENMCIDPNINPFNVDLIHAFLEQHFFISYLESLSNCKLVGCIQRLKPNTKINVNGAEFEVVKLIGEGAYGAVFCGKETRSGKLVAMKQEKPSNYWEYYICLEIQDRIQIDEMLPAFMSIDHALIGNNSSILISQFSKFGSLISVCNKIKKHTLKNVDEYVVMLLACELLEIMDHLHAINIIHADIKADNILFINKLTYPTTERCLQLIDFGVSIDMKLFKKGQTFSYCQSDNLFKCPEMREKRQWTYQLDLFGLAGILHVLLFGKYMDIEKKSSGFWMHKTHVPRYFNKPLWDTIFKSLLNIRDCNSMPNLQNLRALIKEEIEEKEKYVVKMLMEFNKALLY